MWLRKGTRLRLMHGWRSRMPTGMVAVLPVRAHGVHLVGSTGTARVFAHPAEVQSPGCRDTSADPDQQNACLDDAGILRSAVARGPPLPCRKAFFSQWICTICCIDKKE
jgi:hypothetical protein